MYWEDLTYLAIHVKKDGRWKLESLRKTSVPKAASSPLEPLAWLVGDWIDPAPASTVAASVQWTKNKRFLSCSFQLSVPGTDDLQGTEMIGWNPATGKIHSWTFGCDGDLGEGVWSKKGNEWDVTFNQVLSDGHKMSATHIYTMLDGNTCTWQATGRQMDGKSLPDIGPVKLVRRRAVADAQRTRKGVGSRIDASGEFCYDNHMPRRIRASAGGIVYHVLNRGVGRMRLFRKAADFAAMETVLADA